MPPPTKKQKLQTQLSSNSSVSFEQFKKLIENLPDICFEVQRDGAAGEGAKTLDECALWYYESFYRDPDVRRKYPYKVRACPKNIRDKLLWMPESQAVGEPVADHQIVEGVIVKVARMGTFIFPVPFFAFKSCIDAEKVFRVIGMERKERQALLADEKKCEVILKKFYNSFYMFPKRKSIKIFKNVSNLFLSSLLKHGEPFDTMAKQSLEKHAAEQKLRRSIVSFEVFEEYLLNMYDIVWKLKMDGKQYMTLDFEKCAEALYLAFYLKPEIRNKYKFKWRPCSNEMLERLLVIPDAEAAQELRQRLPQPELLSEENLETMQEDDDSPNHSENESITSEEDVRKSLEKNKNSLQEQEEVNRIELSESPMSALDKCVLVADEVRKSPEQNNNSLEEPPRMPQDEQGEVEIIEIFDSPACSQEENNNNQEKRAEDAGEQLLITLNGETYEYPVTLNCFLMFVNYKEMLAKLKKGRQAKLTDHQYMRRLYFSFYTDEKVRKRYKCCFKAAPSALRERLLAMAKPVNEANKEDSLPKESEASKERVASVEEIQQLFGEKRSQSSEEEPFQTDVILTINNFGQFLFPVSYDTFRRCINYDEIIRPVLIKAVKNRSQLAFLIAHPQNPLCAKCFRRYYRSFYVFPDARKRYQYRFSCSDHQVLQKLTEYAMPLDESGMKTVEEARTKCKDATNVGPAGQSVSKAAEEATATVLAQECQVETKESSDEQCLKENKKTAKKIPTLPVTLSIFKLYVRNLNEILKQMQQCEEYRDKSETECAEEYYKGFYTTPEMRQKFECKFRPCPAKMRDVLLSYAELSQPEDISPESDVAGIPDCHNVVETVSNEVTPSEEPISVLVEETPINPVSFKVFKRYVSNLQEIVQQMLLSDEHRGKSDEECARDYYKGFYASQEMRDRFPYQLRACPAKMRDIFISFPAKERRERAMEHVSSTCSSAPVGGTTEKSVKSIPTTETHKVEVPSSDIPVHTEKEVTPQRQTPNDPQQTAADLRQEPEEATSNKSIRATIKTFQNGASFEFPISLETFKRHINYKEIIKSMLMADPKNETDEQRNKRGKRLFHQFFCSFYVQQEVRQSYPYRFQNADSELLKKLQEYAVPLNDIAMKTMSKPAERQGMDETLITLSGIVYRFPVSFNTFHQYINYDELKAGLANGPRPNSLKPEKLAEILADETSCLRLLKSYYLSFYTIKGVRKMLNYNFKAAPTELVDKLLEWAKPVDEPAQPQAQLEAQPQAQLEVQPQKQLEAQLHSEAQTQPQPETLPQPQPQLEAQFQPQPQLEAQPQLQLEPQPQFQLQPESQPQPQPQLQPQPQPQPQSQPEAYPQSKQVVPDAVAHSHPVTLKVFLKCMELEDVVRGMQQESEYSTMSEDECKLWYYNAFYTEPSIRDKYPYKLRPCPARLKERLLRLPPQSASSKDHKNLTENNDLDDLYAARESEFAGKERINGAVFIPSNVRQYIARRNTLPENQALLERQILKSIKVNLAKKKRVDSSTVCTAQISEPQRTHPAAKPEGLVTSVEIIPVAQKPRQSELVSLSEKQTTSSANMDNKKEDVRPAEFTKEQNQDDSAKTSESITKMQKDSLDILRPATSNSNVTIRKKKTITREEKTKTDSTASEKEATGKVTAPNEDETTRKESAKTKDGTTARKKETTTKKNEAVKSTTKSPQEPKKDLQNNSPKDNETQKSSELATVSKETTSQENGGAQGTKEIPAEANRNVSPPDSAKKPETTGDILEPASSTNKEVPKQTKESLDKRYSTRQKKTGPRDSDAALSTPQRESERKIVLKQAKKVFYAERSQDHNMVYLICTSQGLRRTIWRILYQLSMEEFKTYTSIHNGEEFYRNDEELQPYYQHVVDKGNWPLNLYVRLPLLRELLHSKGVQLDRLDLGQLSPKILHWRELDEYTNFDKIVEMMVMERTGSAIESVEQWFEERNEFNAATWLHDQWIYQVPQITNEALQEEVFVGEQPELPDLDDIVLKSLPIGETGDGSSQTEILSIASSSDMVPDSQSCPSTQLNDSTNFVDIANVDLHSQEPQVSLDPLASQTQTVACPIKQEPIMFLNNLRGICNTDGCQWEPIPSNELIVDLDGSQEEAPSLSCFAIPNPADIISPCMSLDSLLTSTMFEGEDLISTGESQLEEGKNIESLPEEQRAQSREPEEPVQEAACTAPAQPVPCSIVHAINAPEPQASRKKKLPPSNEVSSKRIRLVPQLRHEFRPLPLNACVRIETEMPGTGEPVTASPVISPAPQPEAAVLAMTPSQEFAQGNTLLESSQMAAILDALPHGITARKVTEKEQVNTNTDKVAGPKPSAVFNPPWCRAVFRKLERFSYIASLTMQQITKHLIDGHFPGSTYQRAHFKIDGKMCEVQGPLLRTLFPHISPLLRSDLERVLGDMPDFYYNCRWRRVFRDHTEDLRKKVMFMFVDVTPEFGLFSLRFDNASRTWATCSEIGRLGTADRVESRPRCSNVAENVIKPGILEKMREYKELMS